MDEDAQWLASALLKIGAVSLSPDKPITWTSGLNAPIYCDNRLTLGYPQLRSRICGMFESRLRKEEIHPQVIAGTATAGIPHAAWLADRMGLPMLYVRGTGKGHGHGKQVEGHVVSGQRCVLIEDTISTGESLARAAESLHNTGLNVAIAAAIFSYDFESTRDRFGQMELKTASLLSFEMLGNVALETGHISQDAFQVLTAWRSDPEGWSRTYNDRMKERI